MANLPHVDVDYSQIIRHEAVADTSNNVARLELVEADDIVVKQEHLDADMHVVSHMPSYDSEHCDQSDAVVCGANALSSLALPPPHVLPSMSYAATTFAAGVAYPNVLNHDGDEIVVQPELDHDHNQGAVDFGSSDAAILAVLRGNENPWPHITSYFKFHSKTNYTLTYRCNFCRKLLRAHCTTNQNLKRHLLRAHPDKLDAFVQLLKDNPQYRRGSNIRSYMKSNRLAVANAVTKSAAPSSTEDVHVPYASHVEVERGNVNDCIMKLFINEMIPLKVVESESFKQLIATLDPTKEAMSLEMLNHRIDGKYDTMRRRLIEMFSVLKYLSVSANCWVGNNSMYLTMKAHWIDTHTKQRQEAFLCCRRIPVLPPFPDLISEGVFPWVNLRKAIANVLQEFDIKSKVQVIITDSYQHFVHKFTFYESRYCEIGDYGVGHSAFCCKAENYVSNNIGFRMLKPVCVTEMIGNIEMFDNDPPSYVKCVAHSLNLVVSSDLENFLKSCRGTDEFIRLYSSTHEMVQSLFTVYSQKQQFAASVDKAIGDKLIVPDSNTWRAVYEAIVHLNKVLAAKLLELNGCVRQEETLSPFEEHGVKFLKEWERIMSLFVQALETVKNPRNAYLGFMLPTIVVILKKLKTLKEKVIHCKPLIEALESTIRDRYGGFFKERRCYLASAFHPKFKLHWLQQYDGDMTNVVKTEMVSVVEKVMKTCVGSTENSREKSDNGSSEDDFFASVTQSDNDESVGTRALRLVEKWLYGPWHDNIENSDIIDDMFVKYNTPTMLPASTEGELWNSVQRALDEGDDEMCHKVVFLNCNKEFS